MKLLIGLDVGTQGLRACVFRQDGKKIAEYKEEFSTKFPHLGQAEQDPEEWWSATINALSNISKTSNLDLTKIVAISYACTSCTAVVLDRKGDSLRPAILWLDERAIEEAETITETQNPVLRYSGGKVSPQWMLPKIAWLMKHEREVFDRAYRIVEQTDYFTYHLSDQWTLSYNNLVAKWNYANPVGGWPDGFLESAGVLEAKNKWPDTVLPVGSKVGHLSPQVANETGLPQEILVVQGGIDSHAAMVGLSAVEPGEAAIVMGTSTVVHAQSHEPIFADIWGPYPDALVPNTYILGGGQTTTGSIIQWLVSNLTQENDESLESLLDRLEREATEIPPGSNGLVALDYFQGNRTPFKDTKARGVIWGLTLWHTLPHLLRVFYEAIAFGTRSIVENLEDNGFELTRIVAGGGGARSKLMVQILADICDFPINLTEEFECTALGAAIWAGLGAGVFSSYGDATEQMVRIKRTVTPEPHNKDIYDFYFDKYLRTYKQLRGLFHEVVDFEKISNWKKTQGGEGDNGLG